MERLHSKNIKIKNNNIKGRNQLNVDERNARMCAALQT